MNINTIHGIEIDQEHSYVVINWPDEPRGLYKPGEAQRLAREMRQVVEDSGAGEDAQAAAMDAIETVVETANEVKRQS